VVFLSIKRFLKQLVSIKSLSHSDCRLAQAAELAAGSFGPFLCF
jgi:hypothetical protein